MKYTVLCAYLSPEVLSWQYMGEALHSGPAGLEFLKAHWVTGVLKVLLYSPVRGPRLVTSTCKQPHPSTPVLYKYYFLCVPWCEKNGNNCARLPSVRDTEEGIPHLSRCLHQTTDVRALPTQTIFLTLLLLSLMDSHFWVLSLPLPQTLLFSHLLIFYCLVHSAARNSSCSSPFP